MKRGDVLADLDAALKEITVAVALTGRPGTLTLKLKIKPDGTSNAESPLFAIEDDIGIKKPRKSRGVSRFFGDEEGNLLRTDPRQSELRLEAVPSTGAETPGRKNDTVETQANG